MTQPYDPTRAAAPPVVAPEVVEGERTVLRRPPAAEIATIPALPPPSVAGHPVSARTGEPQRPVLLGIACGLMYGGAAVAAAGLLKVLWDSATIAGFPTAARMLTWVKDLQPVSFTAIVMVLLVAVVGCTVAAGAGAAAYNAWNGVSWTRIGGVVAAVLSLLTILLNPLAMVAMAPIVIGAGLLWLPQLTPYLAAWRAIREHVPVRPGYATGVVYGPLPRYV